TWERRNARELIIKREIIDGHRDRQVLAMRGDLYRIFFLLKLVIPERFFVELVRVIGRVQIVERYVRVAGH
ncbi:MAG TPA: hypothetical protein VFH43_07460, partial [Candidatus Kapabacteria bacterium]|nr:hypothetical protein [Candidatus Kapabacteria bacterium]